MGDYMSKPFLKWVGGKHKVIKNIVPHIRECSGTRFIEPFVGSAAISIQVHEQFEKLLLADFNFDLINLYDILKNGDIEYFVELTSCFFGKDTQFKAAATHRANLLFANRSAAAKKAWKTRRRNSSFQW